MSNEEVIRSPNKRMTIISALNCKKLVNFFLFYST